MPDDKLALFSGIEEGPELDGVRALDARFAYPEQFTVYRSAVAAMQRAADRCFQEATNRRAALRQKTGKLGWPQRAETPVQRGTQPTPATEGIRN